MRIESGASGIKLIVVVAALVAVVGIAICLAAWFLLGPPVLGSRAPLVSTDGQLAFVSDRDGALELYLMNADGSDPTRLTYGGVDVWSAAWSPDGRYIAFVQDRTDAADIYVLDVVAALAGSEPAEPVRVTGQDGFDGYPVWSPDGKWLAFGSGALVPGGAYLADVEELLADPAGSEPRLLKAWAGHPTAWSPDGAHLACEASVGGVTIISIDDSFLQGRSEAVETAHLDDARRPVWAPDGSALVFERNSDLYRVSASGDSLIQLTDEPGGEYGAAWSPDGKEIAYLSREPGNSDLGRPYVMNADGTGQRRLRNVGADHLAWSPDSSRLAFYSNRGRGLGVNGEIWVMNRDGTGLTLLTNDQAFDCWPSWRP